METTINQRIESVLMFTNLSLTAFAKQIGVAQTSLRDCVKNNAEPKYSTLNKIIIANPLISTRWLLAGEGEMLKSPPSSIDAISSSANGNSGGINGNIIGGVNGNINGNGNQVGIIPSDCEKELVKAQFESDHLKKEVKSLKEQLKQALADKDKAMDMLHKALSK